MSSTDSSAYAEFTAEERAAMKDHAQELKKAARRGSRADKAAEAERDVLAKIAEMQDSDRIRPSVSMPSSRPARRSSRRSSGMGCPPMR